MSRERLEAGKALLQELLGELVRHRRDRFESIEQLLAEAEPLPSRPKRRRPCAGRDHLAEELLEYRRQQLLDTPVSPAFNGLTPRQAAQEPKHQAELAEWFKKIEYLEERRREAGEPFLDVNELHRELGLPPM